MIFFFKLNFFFFNCTVQVFRRKRADGLHGRRGALRAQSEERLNDEVNSIMTYANLNTYGHEGGEQNNHFNSFFSFSTDLNLCIHIITIEYLRFVITPPRNRGGVIFSLRFSCEQNSSRTDAPIWTQFSLHFFYYIGSKPIEIGDLGSKFKVTVT